MKINKNISKIIFIILSILAALTIVKQKQELRYFKGQVKHNLAQIEQYKEYVPYLLNNYELELSNITEADYKNAEKDPINNENIKFCIIVSSYNNVKYVSQNLNSVFRQNYHNWRMKFFDDHSDDGMSELIKTIKIDSNLTNEKFSVARHPQRLRSATYNIYDAAHNFCHDNEVIVLLDGDDMLAHNNVLDNLAKTYQNNNIWMTYGSFIQTGTADLDSCCNREINKKKWSRIRSLPWSTSHLRTAYTWLFKKINQEDLKYNGEFLKVAWDKALLYPMLEMSGPDRIKYLKEIMYIYRMHPKNDHILYREEQDKVDKYVLNLAPYKQIENK